LIYATNKGEILKLHYKYYIKKREKHKKKKRIPKKLVNLKMMLKESDRKVKIQGQQTEAFGIKIGLRQVDALSATLFNIMLEKAIRNIETSSNRTIFNRRRQYIA